MLVKNSSRAPVQNPGKVLGAGFLDTVRGVEGLPRPPKDRRVEFIPHLTYFKPQGVPLGFLDEVALTIEELEALRLKDLEGLDQEGCAKKMQVARTTFRRILVSARAKVAEALINGKAIRIEGGNYRLAVARFICLECMYDWEAGGIQRPCPKCGARKVQRMEQNGSDFHHPHRGDRGRWPEKKGGS